jgi:hypothetical protein
MRVESNEQARDLERAATEGPHDGFLVFSHEDRHSNSLLGNSDPGAYLVSMFYVVCLLGLPSSIILLGHPVGALPMSHQQEEGLREDGVHEQVVGGVGGGGRARGHVPKHVADGQQGRRQVGQLAVQAHNLQRVRLGQGRQRSKQHGGEVDQVPEGGRNARALGAVGLRPPGGGQNLDGQPHRMLLPKGDKSGKLRDGARPGRGERGNLRRVGTQAMVSEAVAR